jgi:amino acid transporter
MIQCHNYSNQRYRVIIIIIIIIIIIVIIVIIIIIIIIIHLFPASMAHHSFMLQRFEDRFLNPQLLGHIVLVAVCLMALCMG